MKGRIEALEKALSPATSPMCEAVFHFGRMDGDQWQGPDGFVVIRSKGEDESQFEAKVIREIQRHCNNDLVRLMKMLGELLPG